MNFLFDLAQEARIRSAQQAAQQANEKAGDASSDTVDLKRRVEVLALGSQALFEILRDRIGITEAEVMLRMAEIDGRDGNKDTKMSPQIVSCRKCERKVSTARLRCMYCGAPISEGHLFAKA